MDGIPGHPRRFDPRFHEIERVVANNLLDRQETIGSFVTFRVAPVGTTVSAPPRPPCQGGQMRNSRAPWSEA
jgi:hypothetical protein